MLVIVGEIDPAQATQGIVVTAAIGNSQCDKPPEETVGWETMAVYAAACVLLTGVVGWRLFPRRNRSHPGDP